MVAPRPPWSVGKSTQSGPAAGSKANDGPPYGEPKIREERLLHIGLSPKSRFITFSYYIHLDFASRGKYPLASLL